VDFFTCLRFSLFFIEFPLRPARFARTQNQHLVTAGLVNENEEDGQPAAALRPAERRVHIFARPVPRSTKRNLGCAPRTSSTSSVLTLCLLASFSTVASTHMMPSIRKLSPYIAASLCSRLTTCHCRNMIIAHPGVFEDCTEGGFGRALRPPLRRGSAAAAAVPRNTEQVGGELVAPAARAPVAKRRVPWASAEHYGRSPATLGPSA